MIPVIIYKYIYKLKTRKTYFNMLPIVISRRWDIRIFLCLFCTYFYKLSPIICITLDLIKKQLALKFVVSEVDLLFFE